MKFSKRELYFLYAVIVLALAVVAFNLSSTLSFSPKTDIYKNKIRKASIALSFCETANSNQYNPESYNIDFYTLLNSLAAKTRVSISDVKPINSRNKKDTMHIQISGMPSDVINFIHKIEEDPRALSIETTHITAENNKLKAVLTISRLNK